VGGLARNAAAAALVRVGRHGADRALRRVGDERLGAYAACFIAAALAFGMLLEGWLGPGLTLGAAFAGAAVLAVPLRAVAADDWVIHVGLNAVAVSILLHVAIGRRWPFGVRP
jgi:hypothetical protein